MFIEQAVSKENRFWKYIIGSLAVIVASFIGQLPFLIVLIWKVGLPELQTLDPIGVMTALPSNLSLFLMMLSFAATLPVLWIIVRFLHNQSWRSMITGRQRVDWKRIWFAFFLWAAITVVVTGVDYMLSPQDYVVNFHLVPFLGLLAIGTLMIPMQTSAEEFIFRGYLMQGFANLGLNRWFPLIMTSVTFGMMHIANPEVDKMGYSIMFYYIGTGLFLGIITLMDDGMELALGFHAANNLVGALLVTTEWSAFQTHSILKDISEPTATTDIFLPVLIVYPILLLIFARKYKWTGWADKLTRKFNRDGNPILQTNPGESNL